MFLFNGSLWVFVPMLHFPTIQTSVEPTVDRRGLRACDDPAGERRQVQMVQHVLQESSHCLDHNG